MKKLSGKRSLAILLALAVVVTQLGRDEPPADAGVFEQATPGSYAEIWAPHSEYTGGIADETTCTNTAANNSWYLEPVKGCPKTLTVTLPADVGTATKAELFLDVWVGRVDHIVRYSINGGPTRTVNAGYDNSRTPVVLDVPVTELQAGANTVTFSVNNSKYHIHDMAFRLYGVGGTFPSGGSLNSVGGVSAAAGGVLDVTGTEQVTITATVPGADRVEFIAYYDGYDEDNDGQTTDWHAFTRMNFNPGGKPSTGYTIPPEGGTIGHIGTDLNDGDDNYSVTWDTSLIASQSGVKIKARAVKARSGGRLDITDAIGGVSGSFEISRSSYLVEYFRDPDFTDFALHLDGTRPDSGTRSMDLPSDLSDWQSVQMMGLYWGSPSISWNGGTPTSAFNFINNGNPANDDVWDLSVIDVDLGDLAAGTNEITYGYQTEPYDYGQHIEEPGPMLIVKRAGELRIYQQPQSQTALDGQQVTLSVDTSSLAAVSYQWTLDGVDIAGADQPTYTFVADFGAGASQDYRVRVTDGADTLTSQVATLTVVEDAFQGDDFSDPVASGALWDQVDSIGDSRFVYTGEQAILSVPESAVSHEPWTAGNRAPTLRQALSNTDFDIHAAFESTPSAAYQMQGVVVAGPGAFLRFNVHHNGTNLVAFAGRVAGGSGSTKLSKSVSPDQAGHIRVQRVGNTYTMYTSADGSSWNSVGSFTDSLAVTEFGPFGGNAVSGASAPAYHAVVDFVQPVPAPAETESDTTPAVISNAEVIAGSTSVTVRWATNEPSTGVVGYTIGAVAETRTSDVLAYEHEVLVSGLSPETTYSFAIEAEDFNGNTSQSSVQGTTLAPGEGGTVFDVWFGDEQDFGQLGLAQRWVNVLGRVSDPQGVSTLSYRLNGGAPVAMQLGADGRRLHGAGDFNADLLVADLVPGENTVEFTAVDATGDSTSHVVIVNWTPGVEWALPWVVDWSEVASVTDAVQPVDGYWAKASGGLAITNVDDGYDRIVAVGDVTWEQYEVTVPFMVNSIAPGADDSPSNGPGVGIIMRWNGHNDSVDPGSQPLVGFKADGASPTPFGAFALWRDPAGAQDDQIQLLDEDASLVRTDLDAPLSLGVEYTMRARVDGTTPATYRFKMWRSDQPEPAGWDVSWTAAGDAQDPTGGSLALVAHEVDAVFGDVVVTPAGPVDAAAPTISPAESVIHFGDTISLTSAEAGATIFYTTDGTTPTATSNRYTGPFSISGTQVVVNAIAMRDGADPSPVATRTYDINLAPVVDAGAGSTITMGSAASLSGTVTDDALTPGVTITWSRQSGPGTVSFANPSAAITTATFSAPGTYVLELTADDGLGTASDTVSVVVEGARVGYWMLDAQGRVYAFGDGELIVPTGSKAPVTGPAVKILENPSGAGLWILEENGTVHALGGAPHHGNVDTSGFIPGEKPATMAPMPGGNGYFVFTTVGRVIAFGTAKHHGDLVEMGLAEVLVGPIVDSSALPDGSGYYMVGSDGGIFAFGNAEFAGSVPQVVSGPLDSPVNGLVADPDGRGYWLVAGDGGVFAFDAAFVGSLPGVLPPGTQLVSPVNGLVPYGDGYLMVAGDGGIFNFSSLEFLGSLGGVNIPAPIVGVAPVA
ncbi:MAG: chitobiase/beta-hexosaminidase C-terminal domain-containing protein [Acidimicrobiales bacterium]|nr:chitobiase/beta-hexosaminidase C-terminal domain-containing protein [Acidimicrobiales bacterium]